VNGSRALRLEPTASTPNLIGGFSGNSVATSVVGATIAGGGAPGTGGENTVTSAFGTIGGGRSNTASGFAGDSTVGGGRMNTASGHGSTIGGGDHNTAGPFPFSIVAGGEDNAASSDDSTVVGGAGNTASGTRSIVAGGYRNIASGGVSSVAGGAFNTASGDYSFAAGRDAKATHSGSFVWADFQGQNFASTAANEFSARATGGVRFVSGLDPITHAPNAGVSLAPGGGSWSSLSDRTMKRDFAAVDGGWLLDRIAGLPIATWSYKAQKPSIRHLGPTAQDFARAFGLGEDKRHIDSIDSEGVSLAGIQVLYKLVQTQQRQLREQQRELDVLKAQVAKLQRGRTTASR
jgi:hypothetical protein